MSRPCRRWLILKLIEIRTFKISQRRQGLDILDDHDVLFDADQFVIAELSQSSVDMRYAQAERIPDQLLGQRHSKRAFVRQADNLQPRQELQQEMGDPFERRSSP